MSYLKRLKRLERRRRRSCPECGLRPDDRRPIAVIYEEDPDKSFKGNPHECCGRCGRPLYTVLRVVRDKAAAGEEGGGGLT